MSADFATRSTTIMALTPPSDGSPLKVQEMAPTPTVYPPPCYKVAKYPQMPAVPAVYLDSSQPPLPQKVISAPYDYVTSLPSKGRRSYFTNALNYWLQVAESDLRDINHIIDTLHNASLMIDDIQDGSDTRRGHASTHMVFGIAQTINTAMYYINEAMSSAARLGGSQGIEVVMEQLSMLYMGQGYDIHGSQTMICPTVDEYIRTIDGKTGGLFELNARLMIVKSSSGIEYSRLRHLVVLIGRYYQLRDDYKSFQPLIKDPLQAPQPGERWCEDLDGGKYTLPLIHLLNSGHATSLVQNVLSTRHATGKMEDVSKRLLLDQMQQAGSLEYTAEIMGMVCHEIETELHQLNTLFGSTNQEMQFFISMLKR